MFVVPAALCIDFLYKFHYVQEKDFITVILRDIDVLIETQ